MNFKNSKSSDLHRLALNLSDKVNLKRGDNMLFSKSQHAINMKQYEKVIPKQII